MISYAQNFEDVMLARAFAGAESGFYVDVGASDPEDGSMTKHFYDRGWHGINIEPGSWFPQFAAARPRDINLHVAVSSTQGPIKFYERRGVPGLSSVAVPDTIALAGETGSIEQTVPARTLRSILDEFHPPSIDFMSIDVEGHEEHVIRSNDWERHRPRVLIVEATLPNTTVPCHQAWEPLLVAARYRFVFFNGINRFYVREEDPHLAEHFQSPVTVLDQFIPAQFHNLQQANERLHHLLGHLQQELATWASSRTMRFCHRTVLILKRILKSARGFVPAPTRRSTP